MRIIAGKYGRRRFDVPTNITARPTTDFARENIFNVMGNIIDFEGITAVDLFAGTGAVSVELLSRGASRVTSVEKAGVQARFIAGTVRKLGDSNLHLIKGDVFRYLATARTGVDLIFADPPYDHPRFAEIPALVLASPLMREGTLFVLEHNRTHDFSGLPGFFDKRTYGSVNFSLFRKEVEPHNSFDK